MLKGATSDLLRELSERDIAPRDFMEAPDAQLAAILGKLPVAGMEAYSRQQALAAARREIDFMARHNIRAVAVDDPEYPLRLSQISYPPLMLYVLGECDLNAAHPVSIVGTRKITPYGADATKKLTRELAEYFPELLVVSGLAYGVDAAAHSTALECKALTVGVVAHGLDMIYPAPHRDLARRILAAGGAIVSQYPSGTRPFRNNFLERNRIVAGMSDATIVIESELKGGAMSTARHAFEADRDVFALPGRMSDPMSAGCNHLIRKQRAHLISSAADLIEVTGWQPLGTKVNPNHRTLFPELDGDAKTVYDFLRYEPEPRTLDSICHLTGLPVARLMGVISDLEFEGVVLRHPGNRFTATT